MWRSKNIDEYWKCTFIALFVQKQTKKTIQIPKTGDFIVTEISTQNKWNLNKKKNLLLNQTKEN